MKAYVYTLLLTALLSSCQQDCLVTENIPASDTIAEPETALSRSSSDPWNQFQTHDEMVESLQIDPETLREYTTEELVQECLSYPLAFDCFAYNDLTQGLNAVLNDFKAFKELETRSDALQELIYYYDCYLQLSENMMMSDPDKINPLEYAFVELMLSCDKFGDISQYPQVKDLVTISDNIINNVPNLKGFLCASAHDLLISSLYGSQSSRSYNSYSTITIYTKNGLPVTAIKYNCYDNSAEQSAGLTHIKNYYPNATIIKEASCEYNCHAYAWYMSEGGEKCWINCGPSLTTPSNVSKFWEDGTYEECDKSKATRVFYEYVPSHQKGDHSAIAINENLYESKWGAYQVVRHAPDYSPYGTARKYFYRTKRDPGFSGSVVYGTVYWDFFPDPTPVGTTEDFSINNTWDSEYFRTEAYVSNDKDLDEPLENTSCYTIISSSRDRMSVQFNKQGIYHACFRVYHIATGYLQALYTSEQIYVQ